MTTMTRREHQDRYPHPLKLIEGDPPCAEVGTEYFFPEPGGDVVGKGAIPRNVCFSCPVMQECLDYALHNRVEGIWGGTTEQERKKYRATHGIVPRDLSMDGYTGVRSRYRAESA